MCARSTACKKAWAVPRRVLCVLFLILLLTTEAAGAERTSDAVLGTVETLQKATNDYGCTTREMALCDTIADAMCSVGGTDIAILNGGDVIHNLDGGEVTWGELQALFLEEKTLAVTEITGAELRELLELGVSHAVVDMPAEVLDAEASSFDGFPQISGFSFRYDPTAPIGERVMEITGPDGTELDPEDTLTLTATETMLSGGYGYPVFAAERLDVTQAEALAEYFTDGVLRAPEMGRITCIGLGDRFFVARPLVLLIALAAILIVLSVRGVLRRGGPKDKNPFFEVTDTEEEV